jgi:hypothetical protein
MKIFPLKFENKCLYHQRELKTKLIYFVYATKKNDFFKFEMNIFVFEFWKKNWPYHQMGMKKVWNEEIVYFVYATEKKLLIILLYHICIPPYTTDASCGGIPLISTIICRILSY